MIFGFWLYSPASSLICSGSGGCEAEYYYSAAAVKDLEYVWLLFPDLRIFQDNAHVPTMFVDSESAMVIFQGQHIVVEPSTLISQNALFRDYVQRGRVVPGHCSTAAQIADLWSKQVGPGPSRLVLVQAGWSRSFCWLQESIHESGPFLALLVFGDFPSSSLQLELCPLVATLRGCSVLTNRVGVSEFKFQLFSLIQVKI